jgi:hypothetical protein
MSEQDDHIICRVLIFGRDGTEILLARSHSGLQFPEVTAPRWERTPENVISAMNRDWNETVICLFELESSPAPQASRYIVTRHWGACGTLSPRLQWVPISDLSENSFPDPHCHRALQDCLVQFGASTSGAESAPFARLNWFEELYHWVSNACATRGVCLTGDFRQSNASPAFSLIRFETNGSTVWFKAVGEPNRHEFSITLKLAEFFPKFLPTVISERPEWNGWLSFEVTGDELSEARHVEFWETAATALGELQIESLGKAADISNAGARSLTSDELMALRRPFFDVMGQLMKRQTKVPPPVLADQGLLDLDHRLHDALTDMHQLGIPEALGHLDPNPGNMIVSSGSCVFLDWAEAYVGNPFFTFQYLLEHARRAFPDDSEVGGRLTLAYAQRWKRILPPSAVDEALRLSSLLAPFAFAVGSPAWRNKGNLEDCAIAGYLRSLTRRMHREAKDLSGRRPLCLA